MKLNLIVSNRYYVAAILGFLAAVSLGSYLFASEWIYRLGFPLDDAWIHQTYARNLALFGDWAFLPEQPSAGSTAPGWSSLLAMGHWLKLGPYFWTYFIGWLILWGLGIMASISFELLLPHRAGMGIIAGVLVLFEWHMTWAAGSGMETILSALITLIVLIWIIQLEKETLMAFYRLIWHWFGLGILIGLGVWIRPDGLILLGVVGLALLLVKRNAQEKLRLGLYLCIGLLITILPYLIFNLLLAGEIWPNTYFAKQAEYEITRSIPIWWRLLNMFQLPLIGVGILLLPGYLWFIYQSYRRKEWAKLIAAIWVIGYLVLYAWRLPVSYQHGRYIMPVIPAYCLFGLIGIVILFEYQLKTAWWRIMRRSWVVLTGVILISFWFLGGRAYALDVAVIESEMVDVAQWVAKNTDEDALIAAHDIGAMGYFGGRNLLDLAGLVSPEVIPIIRDEPSLLAHLNSREADYLVTFPGWYEQLVENKLLIYNTNGEFSPAMGGENMSVYKWDMP